MKRAQVVYANGKIKPVKNLRWLRDHWAAVERFVVTAGIGDYDAHLTAHLRDGVRYETPFASKKVLEQWLHRPVFQGLPVDWFGEQRRA